VIVEQNLDLCHEADTTLARQKISNSLKRKASDALCEGPTKIIKREIASSGMSDVVTTNDMNRFRKNLSAAKLRKFPKLPTTVLELHECVRTYSRIGSRYVHTTGIGSEPIRLPSNEMWEPIEPKRTNGSQCGYFRCRSIRGNEKILIFGMLYLTVLYSYTMSTWVFRNF